MNDCVNESGVACAICLSADFAEPCALRCAHVFCRTCIDHWRAVREPPTCPLCRNRFHAGEIKLVERVAAPPPPAPPVPPALPPPPLVLQAPVQRVLAAAREPVGPFTLLAYLFTLSTKDLFICVCLGIVLGSVPSMIRSRWMSATSDESGVLALASAPTVNTGIDSFASDWRLDDHATTIVDFYNNATNGFIKPVMAQEDWHLHFEHMVSDAFVHGFWHASAERMSSGGLNSWCATHARTPAH